MRSQSEFKAMHPKSQHSMITPSMCSEGAPHHQCLCFHVTTGCTLGAGREWKLHSALRAQAVFCQLLHTGKEADRNTCKAMVLGSRASKPSCPPSPKAREQEHQQQLLTEHCACDCLQPGCFCRPFYVYCSLSCNGTARRIPQQDPNQRDPTQREPQQDPHSKEP